MLPALILLTGCSTTSPHGLWEEFADIDGPRERVTGGVLWEDHDDPLATIGEPEPEGRVTRRPASGAAAAGRPADPGSAQMPQLQGPPVSVTVPPLSVPSFINVVFGEILEQPFVLGPGVSEMEAMISLRTVQEMDRSVFLDMVRDALGDYGLAIAYREGRFSVSTRSELRSQLPQLITSRARRATPASMRPVIQFVELYAIDSADMQQILQQALPDREAVSITANRQHNYLTLLGLPGDVDAALSIVEQMDRPRFAGTDVIQFEPRNWRVNELVSTMQEILTAEGLMVASSINSLRAITLLPVRQTNQLLIFSLTREGAQHALSVAQDLDRAAARSEARSAFVYEAQYSEAARLSELVSAVLNIQSGQTISGSAAGNANGEGAPPSPPAPAAGGQGAPNGSRLTVDEVGNRLIFFGTLPEFDQILSLMQRVDTPEREVLIEVTIAEVTLTDEWDMGLDAVFDSEAAARFAAEINSGGGLSGTVRTGQVTLSGSASASNNQIHILSTPRIVMRSGSEASVQVGTDVPIITSQRAAPTQAGGSTDVLQTVQYRSTGIILNVRPRVYSNNRIDLEINQEVSNAEPNDTANIASPLISNRSISSELSLQDGQTAVLGGLIENRFTRGRSGVPFLKDIPILGAPFRNDRLSSGRTMLVVFVTPYILHDRAQRQTVVDDFVEIMNRAFEEQQTDRPTLRTPGQPLRIRGRSSPPAPVEEGME
ncbi:MAG: type II secretion system protein GspD [Oceanicaulis sp.]